MAARPRTPEDMNRLNSARAAGITMPGGSERQEELASLPGQVPATPGNMPPGITLGDIQRMMSDPSRYGRINAPAKQQAAAPAKNSKGGTRGTPKAPPTTPGTPKTPTGPMQTVELPEPGLSSPLLPSLGIGAAGAGALALAKYLLSRKGGPAGTAGMAPGNTATPQQAAIQNAIAGVAGQENIQDADWSLAKDLPAPMRQLPAPGGGDIAGGGAIPEPLPETPARLPSMATGAAQAGVQGPMQLLDEVVRASGLKPGAQPPKKKRTPERAEEAGGRRRTRTPQNPSGRIEKVKTPRVKA